MKRYRAGGEAKEAPPALQLENLFGNLSLIAPPAAAHGPAPAFQFGTPAIVSAIDPPTFTFGGNPSTGGSASTAPPPSFSFDLAPGEDESCESDSDSDEDYQETEEGGEAEAAPPEVEEKEPRPIGDMVAEVYARLSSLGVPIIPASCLEFGKVVGQGANGTVCLGKMRQDTGEGQGKAAAAAAAGGGGGIPVAIKTITAKGRDEVTSALEEIELETRISYLAGENERGRGGGETSSPTRLCATRAAGYETNRVTVKGKKRVVVKLYLVMSRVAAKGDLHDAVIHGEESWKALREDGKDTGARAGKFGKVDEDGPSGDAWTYTVSKARKLHISEEIARAVHELGGLHLLHLDIKPANLLVSKGDRVTLIDFGEGYEVSDLSEEGELGYTCGTPGYMAPEVRDEGVASYASDIYSIGVTLLELWVGHLWEAGEEEEELAAEIGVAMRKLILGEPKVASLLSRCLSENPMERPSSKALIKELKGMAGESGAGGGNFVLRGKARPGAAKGGKKRGKKRGGGAVGGLRPKGKAKGKGKKAAGGAGGGE